MWLIALILLIWVRLVASNTDLDALLEFKKQFGKDQPGQILSSWNPSNPQDSSNCPSNWHGVECSSGRVISLYLDGVGLAGNVSLSPLSKISMLQNLSLSNNQLTSIIPIELTKLTSLVYLNLSLNNFTGTFPSGLQNLHKLQYLDLHGNTFSGKLDDIFAQLHSPTYIDLSNNLFSGSLKPITDSSAIINSVVHLNVSFNQLSGAIFGEEPVPLFDALEVFDASFNQFSGNVPSFNFIVSLKILRLRCNQLNESIPEALFKETSLVLTELDLSCNQLTGSVRRIASTTLKYLNLSSNQLSGSLPITMGSCAIIDLSGNALTGNLSTIRTWGNYAEFIDLGANQLKGSLPNDTTQFLRLASFRVSNNSLEGVLPVIIGTYPELTTIDLSLNHLYGEVPASLFTAEKLTSLNLSGNSFTGSIPVSGAQQTNLTILDLSSNNFSGTIPKEIGMLQNLTCLDLSNNAFTGTIPSNLPDTLAGFNVSYNKLSGTVPSNLLKFPESSFHPGNDALIIPNSSPSGIPNLPDNGKSRKHQMKRAILFTLIACAAAVLVGIPIIVIVHQITSKQKREGTTDAGKTKSFRDEKCPEAPHNLPTNTITPSQQQSLQAEPETRELPVTISQSEPSSSSLALRVYSPDKLAGDLHLFDSSVMFSSEELSWAPAEILGRSCHGTTYKATLDNGSVFVVKWMKEGIVKSRKEFAREVKKLGAIRHQNLVCLRGYYWGPKEHERIILSDYVEAFSLTAYLSELEERNLSPLSLQQRLAISIDISRCLDHLHNSRSIPHGNLKSSNILIQTQPDSSTRALLTDYTLHRLMTPAGMADQVLNAGALGYSPPEFSSTSKPCPSLKSDVYAFGVILLELVTGRIAGEIVSATPGVVDLIDWVRLLVGENCASECFDKCLLEISGESESTHKLLDDMLRVALRCIRSAAERPEIRTVYDDLSAMTV
ncbi:Leucine-rich repeat protein kinase family protein [Rhynchospora pubera]|uniref:Leucine-rich repeat protein kinase family protein n=1 Tax=Rhynchospora pubera TaxID=906938 RepID=A0AAV8HQH9_9POAL|nr:Leucine-rich repeat protein kinase family protein [Rhynchospora pubera]